MRTRLTLLALSLGALSTHALADELVATRPGVMCVSADVLSRMILPGGDSRTHSATVARETLNLAASGGCVDINRVLRAGQRRRLCDDLPYLSLRRWQVASCLAPVEGTLGS
jgi:hypothetical protein